MARKEDFNRKVPLPSGLTTIAIQKAIDYIEKGLADLVEIYLEQANVFSALVGIYGAKALDATSVYEKHRHQDIAQQRFPDLRKKGSGPDPAPLVSLESKASKRPWALQSLSSSISSPQSQSGSRWFRSAAECDLCATSNLNWQRITRSSRLSPQSLSPAGASTKA